MGIRKRERDTDLSRLIRERVAVRENLQPVLSAEPLRECGTYALDGSAGFYVDVEAADERLVPALCEESPAENDAPPSHR